MVIVVVFPVIMAILCSGAGKTTLATKLAEKMSLPCFYEPVIDNAYLSDFYRDPKRYSFPLQVGSLSTLSRTESTYIPNIHLK